MGDYTVDSFIADNMEKVNQRLDDDYLTSKVIINIQPLKNGKLRVFYRKPTDWNLINCFFELPEWVKKKYNVTN